MTNRGSENPKLNYEPRRRREPIDDDAASGLVRGGHNHAPVGVYGLPVRREAGGFIDAERQFNTRVVPLVKSDPRFDWVYVGGEAGHIRGYISPSGVVQSQADLAALRTVLQGAQPPMPLDLQFVTVMPQMAPVRPTTIQSASTPEDGRPAGG